MSNSRRFRRATDLAAHAMRHSDLDVLRAVVGMFDPTTWLDRAAQSRFPASRRGELIQIARDVATLGLDASTRAMFRQIQADTLSLRGVWVDAPTMETRECLLHVLRLTLIGRIWLLETAIPDFAPRAGMTRDALRQRILRLDIPAALAFLAKTFPASADPDEDRDYAEPAPARSGTLYARLHGEILEPMGRMFDLLREISMAVTHEVGAFG